ncbi:SDR family oxidoreductase [Nocardia sp. CA2R105]|uniref:SDR family NAD(P)-dependent oxidoreductase n=1 Tax=Nocardia coffeae TaxID=2873381 RepID=UPI001CA7044A|nr:SDR family oxidoreductase [Nocardia coffeae]MBY8863566.1 SDR family oxidoreductase [Nocardia coffeae]
MTGSGGGMGGAIALRLAQEGADIALNDRIEGTTDRWQEQIEPLGGDVFAVTTNVTRRSGAEELINAAVDRWGRIDVLVNVVGGVRGPVVNPVWEISEEDFEFSWGINMRATFHCTQLVLPAMMERKSGKIVNIASNSWAGEPMHAHYSAAKAAVVSFTRSCAIQLGPYNINVNAVAPGGTQTNEHNTGEWDAPTFETMYETGGTLGRFNKGEDIANAVLYLASEESRNVSGQLLTVASGANPRL